LGEDGLVGKMALVPMVSPYGVAKTFNNRIAGFEEKPLFKDVWINAGVYWLSEKVFDHLPESGSLEKEVFPKLAAEGSLGFFRFQLHDRFWRSIDNVKDYEDACRRFV
jgi:NDP-sugar pyrophosphorylase family protein